MAELAAEKLLEGEQQITARALFVGQRLDLKVFEHTDQLADHPLTIRAGKRGLAVLFRYGVVVCIGLQPTEQVAFLADIQRLVREPFEAPEGDEVELALAADEAEGMSQGQVRLHAFDLQRLQLVADVLAKSVVLAHYEIRLAAQFDQIEPLAQRLKAGHGVGRQGKQLLVHIGDILGIEAKMVGRVEVTEKPELLWDHPQHDRLYLRLEDEYELTERHGALERKLQLLSRTAETVLSILQDKRTLRVEWYITILIVIEIVITLVEKALGH
jgi:uncharacterized Rmd1/YagE family protein